MLGAEYKPLIPYIKIFLHGVFISKTQSNTDAHQPHPALALSKSTHLQEIKINDLQRDQ